MQREWIGVWGSARQAAGFLFGTLFDAVQLVLPETLVGLDPFVDGLEGRDVELVERWRPEWRTVTRADFYGGPRGVLGDLGLGPSESLDDVVDGELALGEVSRTRRRRGSATALKGSRGGGGAWHHGNIC